MIFQEEAIEECTSDVKSEMTCKSSEDADSGDEIPFAGPDAQVHEIRCGLLTAKLHMQHFTCPGIHRKCIEFEGKLISPRQFTIRAEKDKQKDWKGSIRLGRYNLRTLMELKSLDFYNHAENCSLKCQSRNYIKNRKGGADFNDTAKTEDISSVCDDVVTDPPSVISSRKGSSALEDYVTQLKVKGGADLSEMGLRAEDFQVNLEDIVSSVLKNNNNTLNSNLNHSGDAKLFPAPDTRRHSSRRSSADFANNNNNADVKDLLALSQPLAYDNVSSPSSSTAPNSLIDTTAIMTATKHSVRVSSPLNGSLHNNGNNGINNGNSISPKSKARSPASNYSGCNGGNSNVNYNTKTTTSQASKWPSIINRCVPSAINTSQTQAQSASTAASTGAPPLSTTSAAAATNPAPTATDDAALVMLLQSLIDPQKLQRQANQTQQQQMPQPQQQPPQQQQQTAQLTQRLVTNNTNNSSSIPTNLPHPSVSSANNAGNNVNVNNLLQNLALLNSIAGSTLTSQPMQQQQQLINTNNNNGNSLNLAALTSKQTLLFKPSPLNGNNNNNFQQQQLQDLLVAAGLQKPQPQQQQPVLARLNPLLPQIPQPVDDMSLSASGIRHFMETNPVMFWSQMRELGMLDDLLNTLLTTVDELKQLYLTGNSNTEEFAAQKLSAITNVLDLGEIFSAKIREHRMRATLESNLIHKELQAILDMKRNAEEQKRRLETAKRKPHLLDVIKSGSAKDDDVDSVECKRMHLA